ncbi:MAG: hypothetical protein A2Y33_00105 [Spirochaetes bacterium GWF1_51_8]|nr:MAG: hypothetical protein A2Y33_00105 [Spirochaetes bacterium GWF1_51_8]
MPKKNESPEYSGLQDKIREMKIEPELDVIENIYADREYWVEYTTTEFTSICPKTGLPDFADLSIRYIPGPFLVEEKSLKLYLNAYRELGIFQENATNKILDDFVAKVKPRYISIDADWNKRGGIGTHVQAEWGDDTGE